MARIRSVHPGLFTDEAFVTLSDTAQVVLIGLWTEADDQGVFEWKPTTLRMRLRPAKDGAMEPILEEIEAANCIARFTQGGKQYGAIRNFRRFQRPKKPNCVHLLPDEFRTYVGLDDASSELSNQMEDEGGGEDVGGTSPSGSNEPSGEGTRPPERKPSASKKGTRLAEDWAPSQTHRDFAISHGVPTDKIDAEGTKFRDYWLQKAGKDGVKLDWDAAWRTWVMRACDFKGWAPPSTGPTIAEPKTVWLREDDPQWPLIANAVFVKTGRRLIAGGSRNHSGLGAYVPVEMVAQPAAA